MLRLFSLIYFWTSNFFPGEVNFNMYIYVHFIYYTRVLRWNTRLSAGGGIEQPIGQLFFFAPVELHCLV